MGGGGLEGGREGWALAGERRSSPEAHPSLPSSLHSRKIWVWNFVTDGSFNPWWSAAAPSTPRELLHGATEPWVVQSSGWNPY